MDWRIATPLRYHVVMSDHEATIRASAKRVRRHKPEREQHIADVLAALRDGEPPTRVAGWSAFTAAYIRRLARQADIPPAPRGGSGPRRDPGTDG